MNETRLIYNLVFRRRYLQIQRYATQAPRLQQEQLTWLVTHAKETDFGRQHGFDRLQTSAALACYEAYATQVPLSEYDQQKPWIERMVKGEANVLWPGRCRWFAKSSGTTSDKSKYIPVTDYALKHTHYRGGLDSTVIYLALNPKSRFFKGKGLILGGSFSNESLPEGIHAGDLSATLIQNVNPAINFIRTPSKDVALMGEWEAKLKALTRSTKDVDVTSISGVPSWMMGVLKNILAETGKHDITEVWPNLEVFFHGGIAFTPYREQYKQLIPSDRMHYLETYNASEGFFGIQSSWDDSALQLIIDNRIFYEFIPMDSFDDVIANRGLQADGKRDPRIVPLWQVEPGRNYAMVITTPGLWRYVIGDTVRFTQRNPYKFVITGRTKAFINAFGEELMVSNADEALALTCEQTGAQVAEYTAAPTFLKATNANNADTTHKAHHSWIIEFARQPQNLEEFANLLDENLQRVNSDYEAKRYKGIFLSRLELTPAPSGTFNRWLSMKKGKLGGQLKIPRLSNSRQYYEELLQLLEK